MTVHTARGAISQGHIGGLTERSNGKQRLPPLMPTHMTDSNTHPHTALNDAISA